MDDQRQSRSRPTRKQILWAVGILAVIVGVGILLRFAYVREWKWTGLVKDPDFHKRTLWDWLNLLIVPAVLALGGYLFTRSENRKTQKVAEQQWKLDREIAERRTNEDRKRAQERFETDRHIADARQQDDLLQAYLDQMERLVLDRHLGQVGEGGQARTLARARTMMVLERFDPSRKTSVMRFLTESGLLQAERPEDRLTVAEAAVILGTSEDDLHERLAMYGDLPHEWDPDAGEAYLYLPGKTPSTTNKTHEKQHLPVISLSGANLSGIDLDGANLSGANLSETDLSHAALRHAALRSADLRGADLRTRRSPNTGRLQGRKADLSESDLRGAKLSGAKLWYVNLSWAYLNNADLSGADLLAADLSSVDLSEAVLSRAILSNASLTDAHLSGAYLSGAKGFTNEELEGAAWDLEGATMPNGQLYEDWLEDREGSKEDAEND